MTDLPHRYPAQVSDVWSYWDGPLEGLCTLAGRGPQGITYQSHYFKMQNFNWANMYPPDGTRVYDLYERWNDLGPLGHPVGWCDEDDLRECD